MDDLQHKQIVTRYLPEYEGKAKAEAKGIAGLFLRNPWETFGMGVGIGALAVVIAAATLPVAGAVLVGLGALAVEMGGLMAFANFSEKNESVAREKIEADIASGVLVTRFEADLKRDARVENLTQELASARADIRQAELDRIAAERAAAAEVEAARVHAAEEAANARRLAKLAADSAREKEKALARIEQHRADEATAREKTEAARLKAEEKAKKPPRKPLWQQFRDAAHRAVDWMTEATVYSDAPAKEQKTALKPGETADVTVVAKESVPVATPPVLPATAVAVPTMSSGLPTSANKVSPPSLPTHLPG